MNESTEYRNAFFGVLVNDREETVDGAPRMKQSVLPEGHRWMPYRPEQSGKRRTGSGVGNKPRGMKSKKHVCVGTRVDGFCDVCGKQS